MGDEDIHLARWIKLFVVACITREEYHKLLAFVGGLHLVDGCETAQEISDMARTFAEKYPGAQLFTGHCTGDMATEIFSSIFSHDALASSPFHIFHTGFEQVLS